MDDSPHPLHAVARRRPRRRPPVAFAVAASLLLAAPAARQDLPAGFVPMPARRSLTAIDGPRFVAAGVADIRPEAWVLGVAIDGQARAYGLELLNGHEVVNDRIGATAFAVVWSPYANAALVIDREVAGQTLQFDPAAGLIHAATVLQDRQTGTYWSLLAGRAETGPLAGTALTVLGVSDRMSWAEWSARHPDTLVLTAAPPSGDGPPAQDPGTDRYADYFAAAGGYGGAEAEDRQLASKGLVYALHHDGVAYAVDLRRVIGGRSFTLRDGAHILVYREAADDLARGSAAFASAAGFEQRGGSWFELGSGAEFNAITREFGGADIPRLTGFDTFWYTWSLTNPATDVLR